MAFSPKKLWNAEGAVSPSVSCKPRVRGLVGLGLTQAGALHAGLSLAVENTGLGRLQV